MLVIIESGFVWEEWQSLVTCVCLLTSAWKGGLNPRWAHISKSNLQPCLSGGSVFWLQLVGGAHTSWMGKPVFLLSDSPVLPAFSSWLHTVDWPWVSVLVFYVSTLHVLPLICISQLIPALFQSVLHGFLCSEMLTMVFLVVSSWRYLCGMGKVSQETCLPAYGCCSIAKTKNVTTDEPTIALVKDGRFLLFGKWN